MLEVTFNAFTTERVFRLGQNDRADDLMSGDLSSQKCFSFRKFIRVGEFHELPASTDICPFILHLFDLTSVSHVRFLRRSFRPLPSCSQDSQKSHETDRMGALNEKPGTMAGAFSMSD